MRLPSPRLLLPVAAAALLAAATSSQALPPLRPAPAGSEDEQVLQSAGLAYDAPALLAFFRARAHTEVNREHLHDVRRRFLSPSRPEQAQAATELLGLGPLAVPVLRRTANELGDPLAADRARRCLRLVEGPGAAALPAAAARVLARLKPAGAAAALLDYLPYADSDEVTREIHAALAAVATPGGRPDPVLVRALEDPMPARRAAAGAALCKGGALAQCPAVRKLLHDANSAVRLRAALSLAEAHDLAAVPVLIDLLADLPAESRRQAEEFLRDLAGDWAPTVNAKSEDEVGRRIRRDAWAAWWKNTESPALLALIRKRTLTPAEHDKVAGLIRQLGHESFAAREQATTALTALGTVAVPQLRAALKQSDLEVSRRAQRCLQRVEQDPTLRLPTAAVRLLALRQPEGAAEALLAYLPFADDESLAAEVQSALATLAVRDGRPEPALVRALTCDDPQRRAAAAEALTRAAGPELRPMIRPLLRDPDPGARLRVALALTGARERDAVPVLIGLLDVLPADQTAPAEEMLNLLAGDKAPAASAGADRAARQKFREAWAAWWKADGGKADLARLASDHNWLGYTLLVEVANGGNGRVVELGRDGKPRWTIDHLQFPVDAWVLPGNRVLVAEYTGRKVTERDLTGKVIWEKVGLPGMPVNVQRLPNGHTFIATDQHLLEVDKTGKEMFHITPGAITAAYKTRDGRIICLLQSGQCAYFDTTGKQLKSFPSNRDSGWTSGLDLLSGGRILITQPSRNKVAEYDADGRALVEVDAPNVTTASGLPNGHILASSNSGRKVFEVDRRGKVVWEYQDGHGIFRARRR